MGRVDLRERERKRERRRERERERERKKERERERVKERPRYRIARKFGGELNLVVWQSVLQPPKFPTRIYTYGDPVPNHHI